MGRILSDPPPRLEPVDLVSGAEARCHSAFAVCMDVQAALVLESNLRRSRAWEREAWALCGPLPVDAGTDGVR